MIGFNQAPAPQRVVQGTTRSTLNLLMQAPSLAITKSHSIQLIKVLPNDGMPH